MASMRDRLLIRLQQEWERQPFDSGAALRSLEELLSWLVLPENDTDANCRSVDTFVCTKLEIPPELPDNLHDLFFDVGGALHDAHSAPDVARNFNSTPEQLLRRTQELIRQLKA